jgi:hypothetical protein
MARGLVSHSQSFTPTDGPRESVKVLLKFGREVLQQRFSRGEPNSRRCLPRLMHGWRTSPPLSRDRRRILDFGLAEVLPQGRPVRRNGHRESHRGRSHRSNSRRWVTGLAARSCGDDSPLLLNDTGSQEAVALAGGRRSRWVSCKAFGLVSWCAGRLVLPNLGAYLPVSPRSLPTPVTKSQRVVALKLPAEPEVMSRKSEE